MERLSAECLVRPVAADTDVGVDLHCETVDQRQPFLHFWVQVKAGKQCKTNPASKTASCRFDRNHLDYWRRQPVPVFAALVPTEWPPSHEPDVYIVDVTTQLIMGRLLGSQALHSDYHWPAGSKEVVSEFLSQVVPQSTARLRCREGIVTASPTLTPQYEHSIPSMPITRFKEQILAQLRRTAAFSILFSLSSGEDVDEDNEFRHKLAHIVEQFKDDDHWENFMAVACSKHADQKYSSAMKSYQKAIGAIQQDSKVRNKPRWQEMIQHIECLKRYARDRQRLDKVMLRSVLG